MKGFSVQEPFSPWESMFIIALKDESRLTLSACHWFIESIPTAYWIMCLGGILSISFLELSLEPIFILLTWLYHHWFSHIDLFQRYGDITIAIDCTMCQALLQCSILYGMVKKFRDSFYIACSKMLHIRISIFN